MEVFLDSMVPIIGVILIFGGIPAIILVGIIISLKNRCHKVEEQRCLRRYTLMERLCMRMDAVRWLMVGGTCSLAISYVSYLYYETILSAVMMLLRVL